MTTLSVVPAYGRDYKSKKAIEADLLRGKDFEVADLFSGEDGRKVNLADLQKEGRYTSLKVRYGQLRKVAIIDIPGND